MTRSIRNIIKQSAKFNFVSTISLLLKIPNQIIIGMFLVPEEYGIISFVALWGLYAGLINPGMLSAAQREILYLIGKQDIKIFKSTKYCYFIRFTIFCFAFYRLDLQLNNGT